MRTTRGDSALQCAGFGCWESAMLRSLLSRGESTTAEIVEVSGLDESCVAIASKNLMRMGLTQCKLLPRKTRGRSAMVYSIAVPDIVNYLVDKVEVIVEGI